MLKFIGRRLIQMALLFVAFLTIIFFLLQAQPGDVTNQFIGNPSIPPEVRAQLAERLGLDKSTWEQYLAYLGNFFQGDLGVSFTRYPQQVSDLLWAALPRTIVLFLSATILAYLLGFSLGKVVAWRRGRRTETAITVGGVFLYTVFYPWFAIMMLWLFGFILGWFPIGRFITTDVWNGAPYQANQVFSVMIVSVLIASILYGLVVWIAGRVNPDPARQKVIRRIGFLVILAGFAIFWFTTPMATYARDIAHHTVLPVLTLAAVTFAGTMLLTRSSMLETLREDYILTARAKGLSESAIRDRHAARNALLPVTTSLVLALAFVIGGGIITEYVFSWPGVGSLLLEASLREDIPLAIGALSIIGVLALFGHLIADIVYMLLDPRIRVA
ncbi:MAG TPA: ABC transporter permease [Acidimicrobiia bacterium]|jgi:peptide/nickel transport system permease protein|nr:ABC transporter permease [Acidimicrobiia bacterium]